METKLNWNLSFVMKAMLIFFIAFCSSVKANDIRVTNVLLTGQVNGSHTFVNFDLNWQNSWRNSTNWDAAWIFVKYRVGSGNWLHASLSSTSLNHTAPTGSTISAVSDGKGIFIYRSADGTGENIFDDVMLRWNYAADGVADDAQVTVKVFAIEMVYIPQGSFQVGDGNSTNRFHIAGDPSTPFTISSENAITLNDTISINPNPNSLWATGEFRYDTGVIPAAYPKGFDAFYIMKYELTQGQYADFLNTVTSLQSDNRFDVTIADRNTITGAHPWVVAGRPSRACNYLSYMDGAAYAGWAGLRPMTEFEFEKACRGTVTPVAGEYAWGNTFLDYTGNVSGTEDGTETVIGDMNTNAGATVFSNGDGAYGPLRSGIFAATLNTRQGSGGSYYGVMELTGNIWETVISADSLGRNFQGSNGNGVLSEGGSATNSDWPGFVVTSVQFANGSGGRGGGFNSTESLQVSARTYASSGAGRTGGNGFRCVRTEE
ncbi:MAG: SUMF1/EgtB/PvdO family nonheme iron enzyme [Ignavibacteriales bacterium]|nr:MAG: SUMF1/EgtB/PvdO family nonheme iron enzyme [Ignavibacteriales bacterium]